MSEIPLSELKGFLMEETLARKRFESLLYGAKSPMVIFKGKEMIVEMFNESYGEIYHGHNLLGKPLFESISELQDSPFPSILRGVYETGETYTSTEGLARIINRRTGNVEERYFDTTFSRIDFGDEDFRILAMPREVTDKVKYKKLLEQSIEQLEEEKSWREFFVSTITHDLINPLTVINISLDSLKRKVNQPDEIMRIAERMKDNLNRAKQMTEDLLDVNRLEAGEWPALHFHSCCIRKIVEETIYNLERMYPDRLQAKITDQVIEGHWDQTAINRILSNLVSNAINYGNPKTKVTVELSFNAGDVFLSIHNWGDPISEQDQTLIFNKYHRGSRRFDTQRKGWGIGLTLVKGLSQAQGGNINLTSTQENGTIFVVKLPIKNDSTVRGQVDYRD